MAPRRSNQPLDLSRRVRTMAVVYTAARRLRSLLFGSRIWRSSREEHFARALAALRRNPDAIRCNTVEVMAEYAKRAPSERSGSHYPDKLAQLMDALDSRAQKKAVDMLMDLMPPAGEERERFMHTLGRYDPVLLDASAQTQTLEEMDKAGISSSRKLGRLHRLFVEACTHKGKIDPDADIALYGRCRKIRWFT